MPSEQDNNYVTRIIYSVPNKCQSSLLKPEWIFIIKFREFVRSESTFPY